MNLKTFRGNSMAEALAEVKKDLGRDAVILHTRTIRVGGVLGVGKKSIVEITASDQEPGPSRARPRPRLPATRLPANAPQPVPAAVSAAAAQIAAPTQQGSRSASAASVATRTNDPSETFIAGMPWDQVLPSTPRSAQPDAKVRDHPAPVAVDLHIQDRSDEQRAIETDARATQPERSPTRQSTTTPEPQELSPSRNTRTQAAMAGETVRQLSPAMEIELGQIKAMLGQVLRSTRSGLAGVGALPEPVLQAYTLLLDQEVPDAIAEALIGQARNELTPSELEVPEVVRSTLLRLLASRIVVSDSWPPRRAADRPAVVALVGPTGVGKTTTLAKLAAGLKLKRGLRVGLVTCDTYRIAAVEQLRTYAEIIGVPLKVALSPGELRDGIAVLGESDVVLVDTAGRSQNDADRISELRALIQAAQPDQTHLVLSAASSPSVLRKAADSFSALRPDRLLVTKLDEAVGLGPLLEIIEKTGLPMSFVSTGQEVPDHIERACPERLARRFFPASPTAPQPVAQHAAIPVQIAAPVGMLA